MKVVRCAMPLLVFAVVYVTACSKADAPPAESGQAAGETSPAAPVSFDPSTISESDLALGDSIFHGLIGATSCQSCHGAGGQNGAAAPSLVDDKWLHSDGSFEGIHKTIASGVMTPKEFSGVMPPFGGAPLDATKHRAVAAYVYRLSHK